LRCWRWRGRRMRSVTPPTSREVRGGLWLWRGRAAKGANKGRHGTFDQGSAARRPRIRHSPTKPFSSRILKTLFYAALGCQNWTSQNLDLPSAATVKETGKWR